VGPELNKELLDLASALAYRAQDPSLTVADCVELRDGIRAAAGGMSLPSPRAKLRNLAADLCDGDADESSPASSGLPATAPVSEAAAV
jgi:hypothetical protein